jgi:hypothetical protein
MRSARSCSTASAEWARHDPTAFGHRVADEPVIPVTCRPSTTGIDLARRFFDKPMKPSSRILSAVVLAAAAVLTSTSAYAGSFSPAQSARSTMNASAQSATRSTALSSASTQSSSRPAAMSNVVRHQNGTTVTYSKGMRLIQPYGKHAQPMVQRRDAKGMWTSAVKSKAWGVRTWASSLRSPNSVKPVSAAR